ncbi:MAG TPA: hypothetical protein VNZ64_26505 [Candidatus Acidoferrum sp.]|nr:hypothetical protein [Candidatus Acidoferrum sp.]
MSRSFFCALLLGIALMPGCNKRQPAASDPVAAADDTAAPPSPRGPGLAPAASATAPVVVPDTGDVNATLDRLTTELRKFVVSTRSVPKNFEDFAAKARLEFPPAPAGKRYKIAGQAIVLGNK